MKALTLDTVGENPDKAFISGKAGGKGGFPLSQVFTPQ